MFFFNVLDAIVVSFSRNWKFLSFSLNFWVFIFYNQNQTRTLSSIPKFSKKFWPKSLWSALNTFNSHRSHNTEFFIFCEPVHWQRPTCTQTNFIPQLFDIENFPFLQSHFYAFSFAFSYFHYVKVITQPLFPFDSFLLAAKCEKHRTVSSWPTYTKFWKALTS